MPVAGASSRGQTGSSFRGLKWVTILAPLVFFGALDFVQHVLEPGRVAPLTSFLVACGIVLVGTLAFSEMIFGVVHRMQVRLVQQNRELLALHQAGLDIAGELELEAVLQKIVDRARELVEARYGALSLLREEGGIEAFLTSGDASGRPNHLSTLLGVSTIPGPDRGNSQSAHDGNGPKSSVEIPARPAAVRSLVAVPILSHGRVLGDLYVAEASRGREGFDAGDEETLARFATQAALAIENARLHRRIQALAVTAEREWIARELHDTLAQVLGYVNTKAQAAQELLRGGRPDRAAEQIGQLAEAARAAYADVREGILGLRTSVSSERDFPGTLRDYVEQWHEQSGITAECSFSGEGAAGPGLTPLAEIQILRILQEALANVRKHASASRVCVSLAGAPDRVEVVVEDNGIGFEPAALGRAGFPRFGLATMRERAEAIGGALEILSAPGRGTRVVVSVPIKLPLGAVAGGSHAYLDRG